MSTPRTDIAEFRGARLCPAHGITRRGLPDERGQPADTTALEDSAGGLPIPQYRRRAAHRDVVYDQLIAVGARVGGAHVRIFGR